MTTIHMINQNKISIKGTRGIIIKTMPLLILITQETNTMEGGMIKGRKTSLINLIIRIGEEEMNLQRRTLNRIKELKRGVDLEAEEKKREVREEKVIEESRSRMKLKIKREIKAVVAVAAVVRHLPLHLLLLKVQIQLKPRKMIKSKSQICLRIKKKKLKLLKKRWSKRKLKM